MEKRGKVEKKRGRPRKTPIVKAEATEMGKKKRKVGVPKQISIVNHKQDLTSNIVDDNFNASASSSPGTSSAKKATLNSQAATLLLVKHVLFGSERVDKANHVPVEALPSETPVQAKDGHSPNDSICSDTTPSSKKKLPRKNVRDLKKNTSDLLAQTPQPESHFQVASPCLDEILVNNNLTGREANVGSNIFPTGLDDTSKETSQISKNPTTSPTRSKVMSESGTGDPFICVEGYKVKKEMAPLLKAIFSKYGDIGKESTFSMESRSCLLELVCSIYKRLEALVFNQLTPMELRSMLDQIGDLETVKVDVGWLRRRVDQISKAQQMFEGVSKFEDVKARNLQVITEKQKAVQTREEEYKVCMAAATKLQEKVQQAKDELSDAQSLADEINDIYNGSLVHGLV